MKKNIMLVLSILFLVTIASCFNVKVQAVGLEIFNDTDKYISTQDSDGHEMNNEDLVNFGNVIVWIIRKFGIAISTLSLTIIGIKYIIGSVEERAEYKKTMWPYILGAVLIFLGSTVTSIIYKLLNS